MLISSSAGLLTSCVTFVSPSSLQLLNGNGHQGRCYTWNCIRECMPYSVLERRSLRMTVCDDAEELHLHRVLLQPREAYAFSD